MTIQRDRDEERRARIEQIIAELRAEGKKPVSPVKAALPDARPKTAAPKKRSDQ